MRNLTRAAARAALLEQLEYTLCCQRKRFRQKPAKAVLLVPKGHALSQARSCWSREQSAGAPVGKFLSKKIIG